MTATDFWSAFSVADLPPTSLKSSRCGSQGYVIKVSKELMGLFCYIEKRKRTMIKELAETLKQVPPHTQTDPANAVWKEQYHEMSYSSSVFLHF